MKTNFKQSAVVFTLSAILMGLNSPSIAGGSGKKVHYSDINLDQSGDVAVLYKRIRDASRMVCKDDEAPWDASRQRHYKRCLQGTVNKAVQDVNHNALTVLHQGQNEGVAKR
jgi:UrcA family protein